MARSRQNNKGKAASSVGQPSDVEHLLERIQDLGEGPRKELVAKVMEGVFYAPAKKVAIAEAMKSASDKAAPELVTEAVKNADNPEAKKAAAAQAVSTADEETEPDVLVEAVENASTLEGRKAAVKTAVETAKDDQAEQEIIATAVGNASDVGARKTAVATAVETASPKNRTEIAAEAVEQLPARAQAQIASRFLPSEKAADRIWLMIVKTFAFILVLGMLGLVSVVALAIFREVDKDLVQIMLTVFSTIAGILAGFITGQAVGTSSQQ